MTDSSMIGRIAAACSILDLPAAVQDQWVECAERWGVRSPPALGCLLAMVREAWGYPIQVNPPRTGSHWLVYAVTGKGLDQTSQIVGRGKTEAEALGAALEAAPQVTT